MNRNTKKIIIHITSLSLSILCIFVIAVLFKSLLSNIHSIIVFIIGFSMGFGFDMLFNTLLRKIFLGGEYDTKETETTRTKKETIKTE